MNSFGDNIKDEYKDIEQKQVDIPLWHIKEVRERLEKYKSDGEALNFDQALDDIEKGL